MTNGPYRAAGERETDEPPPDPRGPWVLQTWPSSRKCPDCGLLLFAARQEGFRIDACGDCRGAWLDHPTTERAIGEQNLMPAVLSEIASAGAPEATALSRRRCPDCKEEMTPRPIVDAGIVIDVCDRHGTWFDPGEMRRFITAVARRTPPNVGPEVDLAIAREARLGALRPPADYQPGDGFGSSHGVDYVSAAGALLTDLARLFVGR